MFDKGESLLQYPLYLSLKKKMQQLSSETKEGLLSQALVEVLLCAMDTKGN